MRILIAEDDSASRKLMHKYLESFGECDLAVDGAEALEAFKAAHLEGKPYDLVCLDIMMPEKDGHQVLKNIRQLESESGVPLSSEVKIIMTTALDHPRDLIEAYYRGGCTDYLIKPIGKNELLERLREYRLLS